MRVIVGERWGKTVGGYEVSDRGRVRDSQGGLVRLYRTKKYSDVRLSIGGNYRVYKVHRLVAEVFVPNPNPGRYKYVMMLDRRKGSVVGNLRWCSKSEAVRAGMGRIPGYRRHWNRGISKSIGHRQKISEAMRRRAWEDMALDFDFINVKERFVI